jgi:cytochrome c-type biogenesis protein CcmH
VTRRLPWLVMAAVVAVALAVAVAGERPARTIEERATALADTVRCPTCRSQSVADSDAPTSQAIRTEIEARLRDGLGEDDVRAYLVSRYGRSVLLNPPSTGVTGLVWALPVAAAVVAAAGLVAAVGRRRAGPPPDLSEEDRRLVDRARAGT